VSTAAAIYRRQYTALWPRHHCVGISVHRCVSPPPPGAPPRATDFVGEFERTGWNGGLNWYRAMDVSWHATPQLAGARVTQPCQFLAGTQDSVVTMGGGVENIKKSLVHFLAAAARLPIGHPALCLRARACVTTYLAICTL
jgi:hypothetical protein